MGGLLGSPDGGLPLGTRRREGSGEGEPPGVPGAVGRSPPPPCAAAETGAPLRRLLRARPPSPGAAAGKWRRQRAGARPCCPPGRASGRAARRRRAWGLAEPEEEVPACVRACVRVGGRARGRPWPAGGRGGSPRPRLEGTLLGGGGLCSGCLRESQRSHLPAPLPRGQFESAPAQCGGLSGRCSTSMRGRDGGLGGLRAPAPTSGGPSARRRVRIPPASRSSPLRASAAREVTWVGRDTCPNEVGEPSSCQGPADFL